MAYAMLTIANVGFWVMVRAETWLDAEDGKDWVAMMVLLSSPVPVAPIWFTSVSGMGGGVIFVGRDE